jgi:hypothetical protein
VGIIDEGVAARRVNRDSTGQLHETRFDREIDGEDRLAVHSRKDIPVLVRNDDRPVFFYRDDASFLDQGPIAAFQHSMRVEREAQNNIVQPQP